MSIKANELRIGNVLLFNSGMEKPRHIVINARFFSSLAGGSPESDLSPIQELTPYFQPIPLTPEILEKLGFYQLPHFTVQNLWMKNIGRDRVLSVACVGKPNEMVFVSEEHPPIVDNIIVIRNYDYDGKTFVHHLQNIHFDFTNGEELDTTELLNQK